MLFKFSKNNIDEEHPKLFSEAVRLGREIGIEQRQVDRDNRPSPSPSEYYKINLTRVFLDHVSQELETRFSPELHICYKGVSVVPSLLENLTIWKANNFEFCKHYSEDILNVAGFYAELGLW